jgi:hypothetical protein
MTDQTLPRERRRQTERRQRLDRTAADLNVVLLLFAIGFAGLDVALIITQYLVTSQRKYRVTYTNKAASPPACIPEDAAGF